MAHTEASLSKLNKDDIVRIALDLQEKQDTLLNKIHQDLSELRNNYSRLESELLISKTVTTRQKNQIINLERQCWSNEQYSRREYLEISGIPSNTENQNLEETVLNILEKIDVTIMSENVEACHWLKSKGGQKKVIVKFSKRKDAEKVRKAKRKLKTTDLNSMNISSPVFINDSLCNYYKRVWSKCRKLLNGGFINGFWFTGSTLRLKLTESSPARNVSHLVDLEELFPGNPILKDEQNEG